LSLKYSQMFCEDYCLPGCEVWLVDKAVSEKSAAFIFSIGHALKL